MKEYFHSFLSYCSMGLIGLSLFAQTNINTKPVNSETQSTQISTKVAKTESKSEPELVKTPLLANQPVVKINQPQRTLSLAITVDDPSFLKVQPGEEITVGQVISDNTIERDRLNKQRSAIELQIKNLQSKDIPKPVVPEKLLPAKVLPAADYTEEKANIVQAQMKLTQAQLILASRTP
ncbi:hypothetical protein [Iningainema tapete]|uniref:Uncharacterized protein n=1 Tax=Iningainema tapete BLCC-T55 TaxID=2748662 RepID=A0A8J6XCM2_9CYAN|nr:hypothetical protein [Iningainema tapete]MBD2773195.1 hypothetical protein [Iningainema tapete BLCC-T55]